MRVRVESNWKPAPDNVWEGDIEPSAEWSDGRPDSITDAEMCEVLFRFFNVVDADDEARLLNIGYELPSLSVGDLLIFGDPPRKYRVEGVGFSEVL